MGETTRISEPGFYPALSPGDYHADPAPAPSLSASIAIELVARTPFHAWAKHPRLNAEWRGRLGLDEPDSDRKRELGSVAHELLLGRGAGIHVIMADSYRTKAAQEERDRALAEGAVPCLAKDLDKAEEIVACIRGGLKRVPGCGHAFAGDGSSELAAVWREPGLDVWGRILIDWYCERGGAAEVWDLKTTSAGLSDDALLRKIAGEHLDLRCAWYERGVTRLRPELAGRVAVNLVFVEAAPPYEIRVVRLGGASLALGHKKAAYALWLWRRCLHAGAWPGYPPEITRLDLPNYAQTRWLEREEADDDVRVAIQADPLVSTLPSPERARDDELLEIVP